jgi:hypothetical protein
MTTLQEKISKMLKDRKNTNEAVDADASGVSFSQGQDQGEDVDQHDSEDKVAMQRRGIQAGLDPDDESGSTLNRHTPNNEMAKAEMGLQGYEVNPDNAKAFVLTNPQMTEEDVKALFDGENLTEDFKTKTKTIFEAVLKVQGKKLQEQFDSQVESKVIELVEGIVEQVDGYLNYIVEQWMRNNELALERGIRAEISENFIAGLKTLFEECYIEVPEDKYDVLEGMAEQMDSMEKTLNEAIESNVKLTKENVDFKKNQVISTLVDGLTDTDVAKFKKLAEEISFSGSDEYLNKLKTIKESYFPKVKPTVPASVVTNNPIIESNDTKKSSIMDKYADAISEKKF